MRIGVVLDGRRSAAEIAELARLAETCGFSTVWLSAGARTKDHFVRLALAAAATRRIRLGPIAVSPFEMHPVHIGLALLTLDEIAPGRACLVLGAGGDLAATLEPPARGRVDAVEECLDILRAQAAGGEINYAGAHYRVTGLFSPWSRVAMDRLYLGANRPRLLRLGEADARELAEKQPQMLRAIFSGGEPWAPAPPVAERLIEHLTLTSDRRGLEGCVGRLLEFERLGLTEIALAPHGDPAAAIEL